MPKIYLSPALHAHDNPCSYDKSCGENIHCGRYMDELIPYLDACGIEWKRSDPRNVGAGYAKTIAESNAYKPDIHFVKHTNACSAHNAKGSRLYVYPTGKGWKIAEIMLKYRKEFYPNGGRTVVTTTLAEINSTVAPCVYDEIVFHDNPEDAKWLHEHIREFAEADAKALCEYFGIAYVDPYVEKKEPEKAPEKAEDVEAKGYNPEVERWQKSAMLDGFEFPKYGVDGVWGAECEIIAKKAVVKQRKEGYLYPNLTKYVQEKIGFAGKDIDGMCGPKTGKAIGEYQTKHNLVKDCCAGINTYKVMLNVD